VFKSTNKGQSWTEMNKSLANTYVTSIAVSPNFISDSTVFAGTEGGVFKSTNRGRSWMQVNKGLENTYVFSVAYASNTTLFAGTEGGVFKSTNGGQSWMQVNNGLENKYVLSLSVSPAYTTDGTLFAGTNGGGVFNDPLVSTPVFKQWNMQITEKSKISLKGYPLRINTDYYSEKWTLYENGLFGTDNNLYGTWQQKGGKVIMFFDPEGTGKNVSQVLISKSHENAEEIIVSKLRLTIKEKKDGTFSGKYKETAKFRENGIKGKITIDRNFIGASDE